MEQTRLQAGAANERLISRYYQTVYLGFQKVPDASFPQLPSGVAAYSGKNIRAASTAARGELEGKMYLYMYACRKIRTRAAKEKAAELNPKPIRRPYYAYSLPPRENQGLQGSQDLSI